MQSEKLMMIGVTVHTDGAQDEIMVGRVIGWSEDGTRPRVKLDKDPSVVSRVGGKQVIECIPYAGPLNEKGLPHDELGNGMVMCWIPDNSSGDLLAEWDVLTEACVVVGHDIAELTQDQIDQNTEEAEGLADGFDGQTEQDGGGNQTSGLGDTTGGDGGVQGGRANEGVGSGEDDESTDGQDGSVVGDTLGSDDESGHPGDQEESDAQQPQTI